jgi:hypothetical protein
MAAFIQKQPGTKGEAQADQEIQPEGANKRAVDTQKFQECPSTIIQEQIPHEKVGVMALIPP